MNLKKVKAVHDQGNHFLVEHETHGLIKVAKKGLDKATTAKIQALCAGGQVQGYAEGGDVEAPANIPGVDYSNYGGTPGSDWSVGGMLQGIGNKLGFGPGPDDQRMRQDQAALQPAPQPVDPASQFLGASSTPPLSFQNPEPTADVQPTEPLPPQQVLPQQAAPVPSAMPQAPQLPSGSAIFRDIADQGQAIKQGADVTSKEEAEKQNVWENYNQQREAHQQAFDQSMKAQDREYDQIRQDVASTKINPNNLWQSMSTGNRIVAALSMVLGGMASGLNGGPNPAMKVIDDAIERDIDAQKVDLGKKQSLLQDNLRKTGDLRQAEAMTQAQMLAGVQGKLTSLSAKFGGPKAQANADFLSKQLAEKADTLKFQIASQRAQMAGQVTQQQQQGAVLGKLMAGEGDQNDAIAAGALGRGDQVIQLSNGKWAIAKGKEAAKTFNETGAAVDTARGTIGQLEALVNKHPYSSAAGLGADAAQAKALMAQLLPQLNELAGIKRLSEADIKEVLIPSLPKVDSATTSVGTIKAQLAALRSQFENRVLANEANYTFMPRRKPLTR